MSDYILELENINKTFPGVRALDHVSLSCYPRETLALVGENGAGKSTLIKIIAGVLQPDPDSGSISIKGEQVRLQNPQHAQRLGVSVIYQEFNLLPWLTVAENVFLGRMPTNRFGVVDWQQAYQTADVILKTLGVELDLRAKVIDLSVAQQQLVEIAKALSIRSEIIIMDEPSAVLAGHELENLFEVLRSVKKRGVTVIYISHRLDEVFQIADRATVLKDGKVMGTLDVSEADKSTLIRLMIGRNLEETFPQPKNGGGETVLQVKNLSAESGLHDISFELHRGEVLGLAGLVGAGRSELARALFGIDTISSGEVFIDGKRVEIINPRHAVEMGIGLVPEDRKTQGLVLSLPVRKNISLPSLDQFIRRGLVDEKQEVRVIKKYMDQLDIRTSSIDQEVQYLSGGNQQKVVLAKWLTTDPKIIILDEPTRGIDVGTKFEMYRIIRNLADQGTGIVMISSELPEIIGMSDRVLVMRDRTIAGELERTEATEEKILRLAIGE